MDRFAHLHMDPNLACEFLAVFSRFEYALKAAGFVVGNERQVKPNWDRFANKIDGQFDPDSSDELREAYDYLLGRPPRKQVLRDRELRFQDVQVDPDQKSTQQLLKFVRGVRNNLFHGGKYLPGGEREEGRNQQIVEYSLTVLKTCKSLHPRVQMHYESKLGKIG